MLNEKQEEFFCELHNVSNLLVNTAQLWEFYDKSHSQELVSQAQKLEALEDKITEYGSWKEPENFRINLEQAKKYLHNSQIQLNKLERHIENNSIKGYK